MRILFFLFYLLITLMRPLYGTQAVYVHSTLGNNTNSGTSITPLQTIDVALSRLDGITFQTCYIAGTFTNTTILITNTAGSASFPLVITAWSNSQNPFQLLKNQNSAIVITNNMVRHIILKHLFVSSITNTTLPAILLKNNISNIIFISNTFLNNVNVNSPGITIQGGKNIFIYSSIFSNFLNNVVFNNSAVTNVYVSNSQFLSAQQEGIYFYTSGGGQGHKNINFYDCKINDSGNYGFRIYSTIIRDLTLEHCYFSNNINSGFIIQSDFYNLILKKNILVANQNIGFELSGTGHNSCIIIGNAIKNHAQNAIQIYATTTNISIQSNILLNNANSGIYIGSADNSTFLNPIQYNVLINNSLYGIYVSAIIPFVSIINNTIKMSGGTAGISISTGNPIIIKNNIILGPSSSGLYNGTSSITNRYNLVTNFTTPYNNCTSGIGALNANPLLINTNEAFWLDSSFFSLSVNSPCIDAGDPSDSVPPNGGIRIDIGAREYYFSSNTNVGLILPFIISDGIHSFSLYNETTPDDAVSYDLDIKIQFRLSNYSMTTGIYFVYDFNKEPNLVSKKLPAIYDANSWQVIFPAFTGSSNTQCYFKMLVKNQLLENSNNISNSWIFSLKPIQNTEPQFAVLCNAIAFNSDDKISIKYTLLQKHTVSISIYNLKGEFIKTITNITQPAGTYIAQWNGVNEFNTPVMRGLYFLVFKTTRIIIKKVVVF